MVGKVGNVKLFVMLKKQSCSVRFIFNRISDFNRNGKDRFMAFVARNDPFFKQLHTLPNEHQRRSSKFLGKFDSLEHYNIGGGGGFKFNKPASGLNLTVKSCFDDSRSRTWDQKARAFAPQLARDLEIITHNNEPQKLAKSATDTSGAFQRGNPLDFLDKPLPEKIAVAVDVDEGTIFFLPSHRLLGNFWYFPNDLFSGISSARKLCVGFEQIYSGSLLVESFSVRIPCLWVFQGKTKDVKKS